ncbi:MAG: hypothetical protein GY868_02650 [Deltaproteobacteria bacterium]|nr:hypothetical protein [Deltaproteobacteria bacterium]
MKHATDKKVPVDKPLNPFTTQYYPLAQPITATRAILIGRTTLEETNRLQHNDEYLLDCYPGQAGDFLCDPHLGRLPYLTVAPDINHIRVAVKHSPFTLNSALDTLCRNTHEALSAYYRQCGMLYQPESLVRACAWQHSRDKVLTVEQVNYTEAAATNLIADLELSAAFSLNPSLGTPTLRSYDATCADHHGKCPSFERSRLANPIGVAGLGVTADNRLVLSHRSHRVSTYTGMLGPSASGYVAWKDAAKADGTPLDALLLTALKREIHEELLLDPEGETTSYQSLGFYRELYRAGLPQGFYRFRIELTAQALITRLKEAAAPEFSGLLFIDYNEKTAKGDCPLPFGNERLHDLQLGLEARALLSLFERSNTI